MCMPERLGNGETGLICIGSYGLASTGDSIDDWTHFLHGPDGNAAADKKLYISLRNGTVECHAAGK